MVGRVHQYGVAVSGTLRDHLAPDRPAGTGPVVDDDRLAQTAGEFGRDHARNGVHGAAWWVTDDKLHWFAWPGLCLRGKRREQDDACSDGAQ